MREKETRQREHESPDRENSLSTGPSYFSTVSCYGTNTVVSYLGRSSPEIQFGEAAIARCPGPLSRVDQLREGSGFCPSSSLLAVTIIASRTDVCKAGLAQAGGARGDESHRARTSSFGRKMTASKC